MSASPAVEGAPTLSVGAAIPLSSTTFVVPIEIADAVELVAWTFDLTFNPAAVRINTGCDSSGSDPYCDLFNGPVTEGPFFLSAATFPTLFLPGFITLDLSLEQTGSLLGVHGAWQDPPPGPSGDGILAYVEFVTVENGSGEPQIAVGNETLTSSAVPEPTTLALLGSGLVLLGGRVLIGRRRSGAG
jgi:hypothetical protein